MRVSIRVKTFIALLFISMIIVGFSAGRMYIHFKKMSEQWISDNVKNVMLDNTDEFNNLVLLIQRMGNWISFSDTLINCLRINNGREFSYNNSISRFIGEYDNIIKMHSNLSMKGNYNSFFVNKELPVSNYLMKGSESSFENATANVYSTDGIEHEDWYRECLAKNGSYHAFRSKKNEYYIYLAKAIKNEFKDPSFNVDVVGVTVTGIDLLKVLRKFERTKITEFMAVAAVYDGDLICKTQSSPDDEFVESVTRLNPAPMEKENIFEYQGYLINMAKTKIDVTLISFVPISNINLATLEVRGIFLSSMIFAAILMIVISIILSGSLTKRIKKLSYIMKDAPENEIIGLRIDVGSKDEVGELYHSFNKLMVKVENLMDSVEKQTKYAKEMEMRMLSVKLM